MQKDDNRGLDASCSCGARFFQIFRIQDGWMALAKEEPFNGVNDPLNEAGDLWYAFGDTYDDACARLELELRRGGGTYAQPVAQIEQKRL